MFELLAQAGDELPRGWEKVLDTGVTSLLVIGSLYFLGKNILPKVVAQHENMVVALLEAFKSEAQKAREYHEKLVTSHENMFVEERNHHEKLVQMIVSEWKSTREQLHTDAANLAGTLRGLSDTVHRNYKEGDSNIHSGNSENRRA